MNTAALVSLVVGLALLVFGRKLFWLAGAAIGFVLGIAVSHHVFGGGSETVSFIVAIVAGVLGAMLAVFLQRAAVFIIGFLAGGFFLLNLIGISGGESSGIPWIPFVIGGILGALLVSFLFDWALIAVSSLMGSALVVHALAPAKAKGSILVLVLFALGVFIQARMKKGGRPKREKRAPPESGERGDA